MFAARHVGLFPGSALVVGVVLAAGCSGPSPTSVVSSQESPPSPRPEGTVRANALAKEFETDAQAADAQYKGRWLAVEGPLEDADLLSGRMHLRIRGYSSDPGKKVQGHTLRCEFVPAASAALANLTKGQRLAFKGKCDGEHGGTFVDFLDCEVLRIGPDPSVPVTAAQLTRDFVSDEKAADARYKDKSLRVEGSVVELKEKDHSPCVILAGHDEKSPAPVRVAVVYPAECKKDFARLKKGDPVKIEGQCDGLFLGEVLVHYAKWVK